MPPVDAIFEKGLPANVDAERLVLGSILVDDSVFIDVRATLAPDDFALEKHRLIFSRMCDLNDRGERVDRFTVANELIKQGQLEAVDGLSYLVSLDDSLPKITNLGSYVRIVKDKSTLRRIIYISQGLINQAAAGQQEPDQLLASAAETFLTFGQARVRDTLTHVEDIVSNYEGGINALLDPSKRLRGTATGFLMFDEMTGGLYPGDLFILAARPSMGKTALALNIAQHIACSPTNPKPVAVFSLEMSKESLLTRLICAAARVDQQKFRAGYINSDERRRLQKATADLVRAPLFIDDTAGATLMDVHAKLRRLQAEHGLGLVVIDYLQLMMGRGRSENRNQEVSQISRGLKLLGKELHVPMLVLSQLSRAPEIRSGDHRPQMSDLRESGSIEQDADIIGFIYREEVYKPDREDLRGLAELLIAKQRNGPTGKVKLVFLREFTKFENRADDLPKAVG